MSIGKKLANEKFTVIISLGFMVFVMSWLYGLRDFKNPLVIRGSYCTSAWNPEQYGFGPGFEIAQKWTQGCALAAAGRRNDIIFLGSLTFILLVIGFLVLCWRTQTEELN
jgi:hypothetical protein